jgi:hypothetical protein
VPLTVKPRNAPDERLMRGDDTVIEKNCRSDIKKDAINNIRRKLRGNLTRDVRLSTKPAKQAKR